MPNSAHVAIASATACRNFSIRAASPWTGSYPGMLPHPGVSAPDHSLERRPADRDTDDCSKDLQDCTPPTPGNLP
jgi:hypothetical protein